MRTMGVCFLLVAVACGAAHAVEFRTGDRIVIGGRIEKIHGGYEPVPGPRQVAEGIVKTFDLRTGEPRQTVELDAAPVASGLAAACGRVFAACEDGSLRCLSE